MGEELGDFAGPARLDFRVEGLYHHFAQPFGRAHDVGGVDSFVSRNQDEPLTAVGHGGISGFIGADGVVFDGLIGTVLHEGDMLMCGGVVDNLGTVLVEHLEHTAAVPHGPD